MTHDYAIDYVWGAVEVSMAIVSICFPLLRPIFFAIFGSRALGSDDHSTQVVSYGNHSWIRHPGFEMRLTAGPKKRKEANAASSRQSIENEENGILGDPVPLKTPDRIFTTVTAPFHTNEWHEHYENEIHVRNDVEIEVHNVDCETKASNSGHASQDFI
ncbi:unnamed protein product [Clonostachys rosea f. rosea IK726]|uniref:Uncharacterized protein n=1 Tax=Clonostachys rosea f. rosea IK726 TaxID=1349383 RepID=A0ACA9U318_BIOOC|nr:unnamed protein product [Clonostachys rosea f. rosea IK726]